MSIFWEVDNRHEVHEWMDKSWKPLMENKEEGYRTKNTISLKYLFCQFFESNTENNSLIQLYHIVLQTKTTFFKIIFDIIIKIITNIFVFPKIFLIRTTQNQIQSFNETLIE